MPLTIATLTNWGTISTGGRDAVYMGGLIDNFGTITSTGASGCGVTLNFYNSTVVNGSAHYTTASIVGVAYGFVTNKYGPATTIVNYGTIRATGAAGYGVALTNIYWPVGGYVRNGSAMDTSALMAGSKGGELIESEEVKFVNYGTVAGGSAGGVRLEGAYDVLLNGSATDTSALIGGTGPSLVSGVSDTVVNFGTIAGLSLTSTNDVLRVEAGCAFESPVTVAGTLSLATGVGTLSDLIGGQVVVSGSMAPASFNGFGTLVIDKGAAFAVAGTGMIASNQTLLDEGVLTVTGSLIVAGTAMGVGSIGIGADADATFDGALPASLTVAFRGTGSTLSLQDPAAFAATIANFALRGTIDLVGVTATGATLEAGDRLAIVDGTTPVATLQLAGAFGADTFTATSDGHGGTLIGVNRVASPLALISAAASLGVGPGGAGAPLAPRPSYSRLGLAAPHVQMA